MSPADWRRLEELLHAASQRPPHERAAFLAEVTAGDTTLAAEIMSLLDELDADPAFLQTPVLHIRGSPADDAEERLGPYRIVRPLGGGGMGDVYLAVRDDPYQLVAVKRVRGELGGPEADRRFRNEGRILAALSHPNIARLLDVGTDRAGRPYVVMEYVPGVPVDQHADAERLDIPARIRLFQTLCSAVQHAHQSLIVHRDIKPANVLVTEDGTPKLLDFGIGKILDADAGTVGLTRTEHRALTPEYASPEQIRGEAITTATDIYSLGVLLHELLGGRRPFGDGGLSGRALEDRILEREPPPPSAALLRDPDAQVRARGRALTGDLDTIVLKAMRKEPYRRYTSAAALAEDLQRHLDGLPVLARPTTLGYRTGKFVRRHRLPVGIGSLLAVTLLASTTVARAQAHRIQEESQRVAHERDKAFQVRTFLLETFGATGPDLPLGGNATARALLDARARTLEEVGDPELRGEFLDVLAEGYEKLGLFEEAERHARAGLRLRTDLFGPQHGDVATSLNTLGWILHQRGRLEEADSLLRTAVALRRTLHPEGHEQLARSLNDLGVVREAARDYEEAERLYRESMEMRRAALGEDDRGVAVTESNLAVVQYRLGRLPEAIGTATRAVETFRRVSGPDHQRTLIVETNLAAFRVAQGDFDGAIDLYRDLLARRTRVLGPSHVDVALTMGHLAAALRQAGEMEEARALLERSLALQRDAYGGDHPLVASTMANLAQVLSLRDDHAEAARHFREAIAVRERLDGRAAVPAALLEALALELERLGTASEAESLRREALAAISARAGADSPQAAGARFRLGGYLRRSGQPAEATRELRTALGLFETAAAPDAAWVRETRAELALAYADANAWADAATLYAQLEAEALPDADTLADVLDALGRRIRAAR